MNIFVLDNDPVVAAKYHCDKHAVKMISEACQMLSAAMHLTGGIGPYKLAYKNHPCTIWVRETRTNFLWQCNHLEALLNEYTDRYGKIHACAKFLNLFYNYAANIPDGPLTEHPKCMPDHCKTDDVVQSYRNYYIKEKSYFAKWRTGNVPYWYHVEAVK